MNGGMKNACIVGLTHFLLFGCLRPLYEKAQATMLDDEAEMSHLG